MSVGVAREGQASSLIPERRHARRAQARKWRLPWWTGRPNSAREAEVKSYRQSSQVGPTAGLFQQEVKRGGLFSNSSPAGLTSSSTPSSCKVSSQPLCHMWWWRAQLRTRLDSLVCPPWLKCTTWWPSHQAAGRSQPGWRQWPSRATRAAHRLLEMVRAPAPKSSTAERPEYTRRCSTEPQLARWTSSPLSTVPSLARPGPPLAMSS